MNLLNNDGIKMNPAYAYVLGLIYPLYKVKHIFGSDFIIGAINHNSGMITQDEINEHFRAVFELLKEYNMEKYILIKTNKSNDYSITPKKGFSVLIDKGKINDENTTDLLTAKVKEIENSNYEIKTSFVRGCFDGRSSWDTTAHFLSIDVDRDYERQDLIVSIMESCGLIININRRGYGHTKNDQIRIKPNSIISFMTNIGLYSTCRTKLILKGVGEI